MKVELMQILQKIMECNNVNMKVLTESTYALECINPYWLLYSEHEYKQYLTTWISKKLFSIAIGTPTKLFTVLV